MSHAVIELFYWLYDIVLLKPHIGYINIIQFRQKEHYYVVISNTINSCCLTNLILKKVWSDDASCPKFASNSDMLWMHLFFANHTWVLRILNRQFWRLTKLSRWKCASSLRIILLKKPASTFGWLIIHSTNSLRCSWLLGFSCYVNWIL